MTKTKVGTFTNTVKAENGDTYSGITVTAATQRNKVELEDSVDTDANGNAIFMVKAGNKKGKNIIAFSTKSDSGDRAIKVKVKIR